MEEKVESKERWHGRKRLKFKIKTGISYYRLLWSSVYVVTMRLYVGVCCLLNIHIYNCMQMLCKNDTTEFTSQAHGTVLKRILLSFIISQPIFFVHSKYSLITQYFPE